MLLSCYSSSNRLNNAISCQRVVFIYKVFELIKMTRPCTMICLFCRSYFSSFKMFAIMQIMYAVFFTIKIFY
ncbi:hypothetical protein A1OE_328 [Candidatus Endolissoclinum faulkneri L2]|uniref:Uncharacterized protein n=1 Tax=Candidatus Endolissoclinum faulkneri L2 TaxID=1193729 RepID=K7YG03_9PROT|nr:hypothetical protein A1OE_328 [Candidatus Endolissoclinum faulkneri L2]